MDAEHFFGNTFTHNGFNVALAPGDGLMLERVAYDRYNEFNAAKKSDIMVMRVNQTEEIESYRKSIVSHIAKRELESRAYLCWLSWFDDNCETYYITPPHVEEAVKL